MESFKKYLSVFLMLFFNTLAFGERFPQGTIASADEIVGLEKECDSGDAESCHRVGRYYQQIRDVEKTLYYYEISCSKNFAKGCHNLGVEKCLGTACEQGISYWIKACTLKFADSCFAIGQYHEVAKRYDEASAQYGLACALGFLDGCKRKMVLPFARHTLAFLKALDSNQAYYISAIMILSLVIGQAALLASQKRILSQQSQKERYEDHRSKETI